MISSRNSNLKLVISMVFISLSITFTKQSQTPDQILWEADSLVTSFEKEPEIQTLVKLSDIVAGVGAALFGAQATIGVQISFKRTQMKSIKEGFDKLDRGLNKIQQGLEDLKNIIKMTGAQVTYAEPINQIENAFHEWNQLSNSKQTEADREEFMRKYYSGYNNAALILWRGLVPSGNKALGMDLIDLYKENVHCNPFKILLFCVNMYDFINKGLLVEDAFYSLKQNFDKIKQSKSEWGERMSTAQGRCSKIARTCEAQWKQLANETIQKVYVDNIGSSNAILAEKIYHALQETVPQRNWGVWVYDDASGYDQHAFVARNILQIWNANNKDVSVVGLDPKKSLHKLQEDNVMKAFDELSKEAATVAACTLINQGEYYRDRPLLLAKKMESKLPKGSEMAVYAILDNKKVGFKASNDHYLEKVISSYCVDPAIRLFVFQ